MLVIASQVICHAAFARVHETAAESFFVNFFPRRGFDERRSSQEYTPLFANDDVFVRHRGYISAARDGDAVHDGDLGYPKRGHLGLRDAPVRLTQTSAFRKIGRSYHIVKDAPKMFLVGEYLVYARRLHRRANICVYVRSLGAGEQHLPTQLERVKEL
jgi:hypothetical protein